MTALCVLLGLCIAGLIIVVAERIWVLAAIFAFCAVAVGIMSATTQQALRRS